MSTTPNTDWFAVAQTFYADGLKVIPFRKLEAGFMFPAWKHLLEAPMEAMSGSDVWKDFAQADGLALLMTDGLEAIDIDTKADPTEKIKDEYLQAIEDIGADTALLKCVQVLTKSGGSHFVYRAKNRQGNLKLASRPTMTDGNATVETLVETRGDGGLLFIAPTPNYSIRSPNAYRDAPWLSEEERNMLIQAGRMCDRVPVADREEFKREKRPSLQGIPKGEGVTPWEAFNEATDVLDMLEQMGWTTLRTGRDVTRVARPRSSGKATDSGSVFRNSNLFYPFTTSTVFDAERAYSPFAVYAYTAHGGDFSAAARALYSDGFGDRRGTPASQKLDGSRESMEKAIEDLVGNKDDKPTTASEELALLLQEVDDEHTFDVEAEDEVIEFVMYFVDPVTGKETGISALGMFGLMVGLQKAGKTTVLIAFVVAALTGDTYLNFRFDLKGRSILWLDCEQPRYWFQMLCRRVYRLAGLKKNSPRFRAVSLRRYSKAQRAAITGALILREKNLGLGLIDGLVDICQNFNEVEHSETTIDQVLGWSDRSGALLIGVIHLTKMNKLVKGHLGTIAQNKCDFAFECSKDAEDARFTVTHREARGVQIDPFDFYRNDDGDPVTAEENEKAEAKQTATMRADQREGNRAPYGTLQLASKMNTDDDIPY